MQSWRAYRHVDDPLPVVVLLFGLHNAYAVLGMSGIGDPASLIRSVNEVRLSTALLLPLLLGGTILLTLSLLQLQTNRRSEPPPVPAVTS